MGTIQNTRYEIKIPKFHQSKNPKIPTPKSRIQKYKIENTKTNKFRNTTYTIQNTKYNIKSSKTQNPQIHNPTSNTQNPNFKQQKSIITKLKAKTQNTNY